MKSIKDIFDNAFSEEGNGIADFDGSPISSRDFRENICGSKKSKYMQTLKVINAIFNKDDNWDDKDIRTKIRIVLT